MITSVIDAGGSSFTIRGEFCGVQCAIVDVDGASCKKPVAARFDVVSKDDRLIPRRLEIYFTCRDHQASIAREIDRWYAPAVPVRQVLATVYELIGDQSEASCR